MMRLAVFFTILLGSWAPAWAQSTATLQGAIADTQNAVMPCVSVTIRDTATGIERSAVTDAAGQAVTDPLSNRLLDYIPLPNAVGPSGEGRLITSAIAPVHINQTTIDVHHNARKNN